jgi:hypothetical protein
MGANETHRKSSDRPVIRHFQAWASGLPNNRLCIDRAVVAGDQQPSITAATCAFSLALSLAWRDVVPSADPPLAGLVWFVRVSCVKMF